MQRSDDSGRKAEAGGEESWWERRRARKEAQAERQAEREREVWEAIQPTIRAIEDEHDIIFTAIACFDRIGRDGKFGNLLVLLKAEDG